MANTSNIASTSKGMIQDLHQFNADGTTYTFALNAVVEDFSYGNGDFLQNEPSNTCSVEFPPGYQVVGFREVPEQRRTLYFLVDKEGNCQIGEVINCNLADNTDKIKTVYCTNCPEYVGEENTPLEKTTEQCLCQYRMIISSPCLGFNVNYPIDIEYKITNCSLNLYFTDNINERRFLYFDYTDNDITKPLLIQDRFKVQDGNLGDACLTPVYKNELDCEKIKFHPDYERPCIEFVNLVNGGNLKAGDYQILIAYADAYGNPISSYFPASQIIPVFEQSIAVNTDYITNKAIKFNITNLKTDSLYKYYNIVIAQTIENFTSFVLVGTFSNTQTSYVYTGFEKSLINLTATDVFFRRPYYKLAKGVTKANNYLFFTGVTEYPTLNLQPVANKIKLQWETVALKEGAYADPRNTFYFRGYQRDEVYAFGVVFEFINGRETCAFHIPGREATATDLENVCNADVVKDTLCTSEYNYDPKFPPDPSCKPRWKVYNTATVTGGDKKYNDLCEIDDCWEYGDFAYWESTELYPNVKELWGDLCGKPIRHHKFPDSCVTHIHDNKDSSKGYNTSNYIFPIGVKIDHESVKAALDQAVTDGLITAKDRAEIISYRIVRGNRVGNKSIDAKGLLFNMFEYTKYGSKYYFPNYAYNDLTADDFLRDVNLVNPNNRFTFHSPDTHFVNPGLGNIIKVETEEYGQSEGYFTYSECQPKYKFFSNAAQGIALGLGLAAAISATGEKKCRTTTYTGTSTIFGVAAGTVTADPYAGIENYKYDANSGRGVYANAHTIEETTCKGETWQLFTSIKWLWLNPIMRGAGKVIQRTFLGLAEMQKVLDTMLTLMPYRNYSIQYNSVGKYNNYKCVAQGNKNRFIDKAAYLNSTIQQVDEPSYNPDTVFDTVKINNWDRESSVYLKLNSGIVNPTVIDDSKVSMRSVFGRTAIKKLDNTFYRSISSYYVSIKREVLNQYGQLCNIEYLETNACSFLLNTTYTNCKAKVFGGDTFINRFGLKRKMPFFLYNMCGLANGSDVRYEDIPNAGTPRYYFNSNTTVSDRLSSLGNIRDLAEFIVKGTDAMWDVSSDGLFHERGYIHLFNYGIPYFLVESDINLDYRHGENNKDKDFYPHQKDLKYWLEEKNVPITTDNYYFYNKTYSKQNKESPICVSCITQYKDLICQTTNHNRIIYSETSATENKNDNWLIFKANDYYDFPLTYGKLITADGIENDKVLARLEQGTQIFSAYNTILAEETNIQVGTGGLFKTAPRDVAVTDLGYAGTQHRDILHTEYGHIWADAERGQVFNINLGGSGIDEISKNGMKSWFKENLPFQIKKDFADYENIDNNLNGIGLHYCFDKRFNRMLITKLDYKLLDKTVRYDKVTNEFYILNNNVRTIVNLNNPKYFCNKSWTISYNFYEKTWTSFHSYIPNFYIEHIDGFESSYIQPTVINNQLSGIQKTYRHNYTNKSYQVFYGKLHPFIIEFQAKQSLANNVLHSVEYYLDVIRYHNEFDTFYNRTKTFNKGIVYNERQTSGMLYFKVSNPEDLTEIANYPRRIQDGYEIVTTNSENMWRFNDFADFATSQLNNVPLFNYDCNNVNKQLNPKALNYSKLDFDRAPIRQRMCRVRLINDVESNYKYIFAVAQITQRQSYR